MSSPAAAANLIRPLARPATQTRVHITFIEGLRAICALMIIFYHGYHNVEKRHGDVIDALNHRNSPSGSLFLSLFRWMDFGSVAVSIFIVISGFCLMLPLVRRPSYSLEIWPYLVRRARRILPPYYAAIGLAFAVMFLLFLGKKSIPGLRSIEYPGTSVGDILTHLTLTQNFFDQYKFGLDGVLWSVAAEWQLYFIFPLLFLPVLRHMGFLPLILVGWLVTEGPSRFIPNFYYFEPHLPLLFVLGMGAAILGTSAEPKVVKVRASVPWLPLCLILILACISQLSYGHAITYLASLLLALAAVSLIVGCLASLERNPNVRPLPVRLLEHPWLVRLGVISYSVYIIHHPILLLISQLGAKLHLAAVPFFLAEMGVGIPVLLVASYAFHRVAERPFMSGFAQKSRTEREAGSLQTVKEALR